MKTRYSIRAAALAVSLSCTGAFAQQQSITLKLSPSDLALLGGSLQYSCPELIAKLQAQINEAQKEAQKAATTPTGPSAPATPPSPPAGSATPGDGK